jgi:hypothetical protein
MKYHIRFVSHSALENAFRAIHVPHLRKFWRGNIEVDVDLLVRRSTVLFRSLSLVVMT